MVASHGATFIAALLLARRGARSGSVVWLRIPSLCPMFHFGYGTGSELEQYVRRGPAGFLND